MKKVISDNNKVINLADKLNQKDTSTVQQKNPIEYTAEDLNSLNEEDRLNILKYQKQMEFYQEEQNKQQANEILNQLITEISHSDKKDIIPDHLYDELYNYLIEYITNFTNESMKKIYNEIKQNLIAEFNRELTNPFTKKEDRLETKIKKYNPDFFKNNTDTIIPIAEIFNESFKQIEDTEGMSTLAMYRLLKFIINTSIDSILFKDQNYKDNILSLISSDEMLQSMANKGITHNIKINILKLIPYDNLSKKEDIINILDFIFPEN